MWRPSGEFFGCTIDVDMTFPEQRNTYTTHSSVVKLFFMFVGLCSGTDWVELQYDLTKYFGSASKIWLRLLLAWPVGYTNEFVRFRCMLRACCRCRTHANIRCAQHAQIGTRCKRAHKERAVACVRIPLRFCAHHAHSGWRMQWCSPESCWIRDWWVCYG